MFVNNCKPLLVPLSRACRLLNRLSTPSLHRRIRTNFREENHRHLNRLFTTLHTNHMNHTHVRDLCLDKALLNSTADLEFLTKVSPHVKSLRLSNLCLEDMKDDKLSAIGSMKLENLSIDEKWCKPAFNHLLQAGALDTLHTLDISTQEEDGGCSHSSFSKWSVESYTLPIRHLGVDARYWTLKDWQEIVMLPRSLQSLKIDMTAVAREWTIERTDACYTTAIQRILDLQSKSLREIEFSGFIPDERGCLVDLSPFRNITSLYFHQHNLFPDSPKDAGQKLLCPKLERLSIDMNFNDQQHEVYSELDEEKLNWLIEFVNERRQYLTIDRLQEIHVFYCWDSEDFTQDATQSEWVENLNTAAQRLQSLGIRLSWPEPS